MYLEGCGNYGCEAISLLIFIQMVAVVADGRHHLGIIKLSKIVAKSFYCTN